MECHQFLFQESKNLSENWLPMAELRWAKKVLHAEETLAAPSLLKKGGIDSARDVDNGGSAYR